MARLWAFAMARLWAKFDSLTVKSPVRTKLFVGMGLGGFGDVCAQAAEGSAYDPLRTGRFMLWRSITSRFNHSWFDKLMLWFPGTGWSSVLKRIALDQSVPAPIFIALFFPCMALLEGRTLDQAWDRASEKYTTALCVNWTFVPLLHLMTFSIVPLAHRVHFANCGTVLWSAAFSSLNAQPTASSTASSGNGLLERLAGWSDGMLKRLHPLAAPQARATACSSDLQAGTPASSSDLR